MPKQSIFSISERKFFLRIFDILVVISGITIATQFLEFHYFDALEDNKVTWFITLSIYILFLGQIFEMYNLKNASSRFLIFKSIGITAFLTTFFYIFTPIIAPVLPDNRMQIAYLFATIFIPLVLWRFAYVTFVFLPKYHKYVLLIGDPKEVVSLIELIRKKAADNRIVGYVSTKEIVECKDCRFFSPDVLNLEKVVKENAITEVVVGKNTLRQSAQVHNQLIHLFENGIQIVSAKKFIENITYLVPELEMKDTFYDYLNFSRSHQSKLYLIFVRLIDLIAALLGVLFLSLVLPFVLIGNLIGNRGGLFYTQERVGEKGVPFTMIKFRTMVQNAEKNGAVWAQKNDTRITRFGKFLRKSRLDEIPQFLNVLKGDMSLIGPRPERPEFVKDLEKQIPFYAIRHVVKPGLTGWAQVMHPYADNLDDYDLKVRYDLYYIKERNLILDFRIVIKTITTVLFFRGQ